MEETHTKERTVKSMWKKEVLPLLPERIGRALSAMSGEHCQTVEEIRLRAGRPVQALGQGWETFFSVDGECPLEQADLLPTGEECERMLAAFCFHSIYAAEEELRRGAITLPGGCRVGLCGRAVMERGRIERIAAPTFFCIRIAREICGTGKKVLPWLVQEGRPLSAMILSPPGCGKTTLLRDLARMLSAGEGVLPQRVCIADERSELAGCFGGIPQCDVGPRTDVLEGCPKDQALELLLRALSPDVLVTDEVGSEADARSLLSGANGGAALLVTAHGEGIEAVRRRPALRILWEEGIFDRFVVLSRAQGPGTVDGVYDRKLQRIFSGEGWTDADHNEPAAGSGLCAGGDWQRPAASVAVRASGGDDGSAPHPGGRDPLWGRTASDGGKKNCGGSERGVFSGVFRGA